MKYIIKNQLKKSKKMGDDTMKDGFVEEDFDESLELDDLESLDDEEL